MKLLKPDPEFERKITEWWGEDPGPEFENATNCLVAMYERWGQEDAANGRPEADLSLFCTCGKFCFPHGEDSAEADAVAEYVKRCYLQGYNAGRAPV